MLKRKSVTREWMISYILILVIPLITIFINYGYNIKIIREEITQAHELILYNLKDNVDRLLDEEEAMFFNFYYDEGLENLVNSKTMDSEFIFDVYMFQKQLGAYCGGAEGISYWLYMEQKDYIINNKSSHNSRNIYNAQKLISEKVPKYDEWMVVISGDYNNEFLFYDGLWEQKSTGNLIYAHSYSGYNTGKVNVFITIPISVLEELVNSLPEGSFFVVYLDSERNDTDKQLLVIDSGGITKLPSDILVTDLKSNREKFDVGSYTGLVTFSNNGKAKYFLMMPNEKFWEKTTNIRNVHLSSLLITVLLGVCMVLVLVKRNFKPVSSLLAVIGNSNGEGNEFEKIKTAHGILQQENNAMKHKIESQEKKMISNYLLSLFKGRITKIGDKEQQIGLGLKVEGCTFALMGFYVLPPRDEGNEYEEFPFFAIDNILSDLMRGETFYYVEDGWFIYYLFCIPNGHEQEWKEKSLKHVAFLCDLLEEKFEVQLVVAISEVEKNINQAKYMYQSVMEAFEYKKIIGGSGVVTTEEQQKSDENNRLHVCFAMLERALEKGNLEEGYIASNHLFLDAENMPFIVLKLRIMEAFQVVVNCYNKYIEDSVKRMQLLKWMESFLKVEKAEDMKLRFDEMLAFACDKIGGQWKTECNNLVKSVEEYVESNYMDSDLNISSIAEKMNRNPKYVSKVFKEETGEGILDYINALRIHKAQEILLTRSVSVEEVSAMVGYASSRTFRRSFAKIVGMTPSEYLEK